MHTFVSLMNDDECMHTFISSVRSAAVTEQELAGAKKALILASEERASNPASLGAFIGAAAISGGSVAATQAAAINTVALGDVQVSKQLHFPGLHVWELLFLEVLRVARNVHIAYWQNENFQAVAKKLASGKLSMSAVGNLSTVPYLDTL